MAEKTERIEILKHFGAEEGQIGELLEYNRNRFSIRDPIPEAEDEPFADTWRRYAGEALSTGVFSVFKKYIVQFKFPVAKGVSNTEAYRGATLKGIPPGEDFQEGGIRLVCPEALSLSMHETYAGEIPIIFTSSREDFKTLVRVFAMRNEPADIPDSMGACMVKGYNNWGRIANYKKQWEVSRLGADEEAWREEFGRLILRKELYQDRFIILSDGPYSGIPAKEMGLPEDEWRKLSAIIRRGHECTHYVTQRLFGSSGNNMLDELIADYAGITAAAGKYRAEWFLKFVGLADYPKYRKGSRLENYRGTPPLSDGAFRILQELVYHAAVNLEKSMADRRETGMAALTGLCRMTLEEMAVL